MKIQVKSCQLKASKFFIAFSILLNISFYGFAQNTRVYGGEDTDLSEIPWVIAIEEEGEQVATGIIINSEWILVSAHQFSNLAHSNFLNYDFHAGATDFTSENGQKIKPIQRIIHEDFDHDGLYPHSHDIALVRLSEPLCFNARVQPATLASLENTSELDIAVGKLVKIAGWGDSDGFPLGTPHLQSLELEIVDNEESTDIVHFDCNTFGYEEFNETYLVLDDIGGDAVAGPGDSGGPIYFYSDNMTPIVLGLVNRRFGECSGFLTVGLSIREYISWILEHISIPTPCLCHDDIYISENTTYNDDMLVNGDIIVETGSQLIITSRIEFMQTHGIVVQRGAKLVVDGGILTKAASEVNWRGINVEGFYNSAQPQYVWSFPTTNQCGVVEIVNNSIIESAVTAISTTRNCETWNNEYYGGLITCENSQFNNCRRAVEFMKYDIVNKSYFKNCKINSSINGITIWDAEGIVLDNCDFINMEKTGLKMWDAACSVINGCSFISCKRGIESYSTSTIPSSHVLKIERGGGNENLFRLNEITDVYISSGELNKNVRITGNRFEEFYDGIWLNGRNSAYITNNVFENGFFSIICTNSGYGYNIFQCNEMLLNVVAPIIFEGPNDRSKFLKNKFESDFLDVSISPEYTNSPNGSIHPFQGAPNSPAKNCFSSSHNEHLITDEDSETFNYYVPQNSTDCYAPQESGYSTDNYTLVFSGQNSIPDCSFIPGLQYENYSYADFQDLYNSYQTKKGQLTNNATNQTLFQELLELEEEKEIMLSWFARESISSKNDSLVEIIMKEENSLFSHRLLLGVKIQLSKYIDAQEILDSLSNITQEDKWFKLVQYINLDRLRSSGNFILSHTQDSILNIVASSTSNERGYAMALLSLLKGVEFIPNINLPERSIETSIVSNNIDRLFEVYPNPASQSLKFDFKKYLDGKVTTRFYTSDGRYCKSFNLNSSTTNEITIGDLDEGVYFLQILINEMSIGTNKVVIIR